MPQILGESFVDSKEIKRSSGVSTPGKILIGLTGGIAVGLSVICASFVSPAFRRFCLPYIPATEQQVQNVFQALRARHATGSFIDLGSGDGRIVFEAVKGNFPIVHGVELNFWLVIYSKLQAKFAKAINSNNIAHKKQEIKFFRKDLWKYNLSKYDNIVIFGVEQMMEELEKKLIKECNKDCNIVACRFPLPNLRPVATVGFAVDTVWVYKVQT